MNKTEQFDKLICQAYEVKELQDKLGSQFKNVRETMLKYNDFKKLSAQSQFDFCCTIALIANQTARQDLQKLKLSCRSQTEIFEFSINRGR